MKKDLWKKDEVGGNPPPSLRSETPISLVFPRPITKETVPTEKTISTRHKQNMSKDPVTGRTGEGEQP